LLNIPNKFHCNYRSQHQHTTPLFFPRGDQGNITNGKVVFLKVRLFDNTSKEDQIIL